MKRVVSLLPAVLVVAGVVACANRQAAPSVPMVRIPPRIDLTQHELIGVIPVVSSAKGDLGPLTTRRLMDWARRDQGIVRMVELGSGSGAPRSKAGGQWSPETVKALGTRHGVATLLTGELSVSDVRPNVRIATTLRSGDLTALVDVTLSVQLLETSTGASIWSSSARATQNVGHISVLEGKAVSFDANDPESAYGSLVDALVEQVTRDFRSTWEQG